MRNYCYFGRDHWVLHLRSRECMCVHVLSLRNPAKALKYVKYPSNAAWTTLHFKPKWLGSLFHNTTTEKRLLQSRLDFKWNLAMCPLKSFHCLSYPYYYNEKWEFSVLHFCSVWWTIRGYEGLMKAPCYFMACIFGCLQKRLDWF